jgi:hypothetical protein
MPLPSTLRSRENFHIVLWLIKDLLWVMDVHWAGTLMIIPTVGMAVWLTWSARHDANEFLHSLAVVFWILANSTWMIGEFFYDDGSRPLAAAFFIAGLSCVGCYHAVIAPRKRNTTGPSRG